MKALIFIFVLLVTTCLYSTIINVPADQPTIQAGINVAVDTDTVLVQPGNYVENINYNGKLITVASLFLTTQDTTYISSTIIDGNSSESVVTFENGEDETANIIGFTITNGNASHGGGIYCHNSSPSLRNVTISGNCSYAGGGGIYCNNYSSPSLVDVTISGNTGNTGIGIYCISSSPSLVDVTISGNGSGIYCVSDSSPSLINVTISDNSTDWAGGGIYCNSSNPSLVNVTISGNSAGGSGGGIYFHNSNPSLVNCILWNDTPEEIYITSGSITATYSDIEGGWAGEGNIDEDPLFVGTGEHPYSLLEDSPCIDAGIPDTTGLNLPPWDIIGNLRIWDGDGNGSAIIDMGAYEYDAPPYVDVNEPIIPNSSSLITNLSNYPNPFNPTTTINYSLKENSKVSLNIYNIKGQKVKQLISNSAGQFSAGQHSVVWNGKDDNGKTVSSGIYFYKLKTGDYEKTKKMILIK